MSTTSAAMGESALVSPFSLVEYSRRGVMRSDVDDVAALVGLTDKEMAYCLNCKLPPKVIG